MNANEIRNITNNAIKAQDAYRAKVLARNFEDIVNGFVLPAAEMGHNHASFNRAHITTGGVWAMREMMEALANAFHKAGYDVAHYVDPMTEYRTDVIILEW